MKSNVIGWSDAKFKSWIIALLRRGSIRYPPRNEALKEAKTEKKINPASGRLAQHYVCAGCGDEFPMSKVCIDHILPVVPATGFTTWDDYINRMYCAKENFQVLCKTCHDEKSALEKSSRRKEVL